MNRKYIAWAVILIALYIALRQFGLVGGHSSNIPSVSEATFTREVEQADKPVLVDFWAPWCGPCRRIGPALDNLAEELSGSVKFCKVNVDDNPGLAERYGVDRIPCLILFRGGSVVDIQWGVNSKKSYRQWLQKNLQ
ncbi:MAG: thioredoxin [Verrucomicrobia bacterium]|nr:thioredoxin [Verrucomicrobiota bacterium]